MHAFAFGRWSSVLEGALVGRSLCTLWSAVDMTSEVLSEAMTYVHHAGVNSSSVGRCHAVLDVYDADDVGVRYGAVDHLSTVRRQHQVRVLHHSRSAQQRRTYTLR